jgi:hypothetical protein
MRISYQLVGASVKALKWSFGCLHFQTQDIPNNTNDRASKAMPVQNKLAISFLTLP